jgi:hypothetical protein
MEKGASSLRKLRMGNRFGWDHHRHGWGFVTNLIDRTYCTDGGTLFVNAVEDQLLYRGAVAEPWVGILHQVPKTTIPGFPDLERFLTMPAWLDSKPYCLGLWTLCDYTRKYLVNAGIGVPVDSLPYPMSDEMPEFDWERFRSRSRPRLLHIGEYLRDYQAFFDLNVPKWDKQFLIPEDWSEKSPSLQLNDSVALIDMVDDEKYDQMITESVVFVKLFDAPANTLVLECLATATPICVNPVGGVTEYLGPDYPLYMNENIELLLSDEGRLKAAHSHLKERRDDCVSPAKFHTALTTSSIYSLLPCLDAEAE